MLLQSSRTVAGTHKSAGFVGLNSKHVSDPKTAKCQSTQSRFKYIQNTFTQDSDPICPNDLHKMMKVRDSKAGRRNVEVIPGITDASS